MNTNMMICSTGSILIAVSAAVGQQSSEIDGTFRDFFQLFLRTTANERSSFDRNRNGELDGDDLASLIVSLSENLVPGSGSPPKEALNYAELDTFFHPGSYQLGKPIVRSRGGTVEVLLSIDEEPVTLVLSKYAIRAAECELIVDTGGEFLEHRAMPAVRSYRGHVRGWRDSSIAASIDGERVYAIVRHHDRWLCIQPADEFIPDLPGNVHLVFDADGPRLRGGRCGVEEAPVPGERQDALALQGFPNEFGRTEIAFDADYEYFVKNGSSVNMTVFDIEMIMNKVSLIYQEWPGWPPNSGIHSICYAMKAIVVRTDPNDPYDETSPSCVLKEFRDQWNNTTGDGIGRDVTHMMTGRNMDGSVIGIAYVDQMCNANGIPSGCGLGGFGNMAYGVSQSKEPGVGSGDPDYINYRVSLTAHELGHNWDACHCDLGGCTGDGADSDCGIMQSTNSGSLSFGSRSLGAIQSTLALEECLNSCLSTTFVDGDNSGGPWMGTQQFPFRYFDHGVTFSMIDGDLSVAGGQYDEGQMYIAKKLRLIKTPGTTDSVRISGQ